MASVCSGDIQKVLLECLYKYPSEVIKDVKNVKAVYRDLHVLLDYYCYSNGDKKRLANLSGTIPVIHNGCTYNIPICIWLHNSYPQQPPKCLVRPESYMTINPGKCIDRNGNVHLSYLQYWKHSTAHLLALVNEMKAAFETEMPVYSRLSLDFNVGNISQGPVYKLSTSHGPYAIANSPCYYPLTALQNPRTSPLPANPFGFMPANLPDKMRATNHKENNLAQYSGNDAKQKPYNVRERTNLDSSFKAARQAASPTSSQVRPKSEPDISIWKKTAGTDKKDKAEMKNMEEMFRSLELDNVLQMYNLKTQSENKKGPDRIVESCEFQNGCPGTCEKKEKKEDMITSLEHWAGSEPLCLSAADDNQKIEVYNLPVNIPENKIKNKLTIYFQRLRNGGGEVLDVQYPTSIPRCAYVTFADARVAEKMTGQEKFIININDHRFPVQVKKYEAKGGSKVNIPAGLPTEKSLMFEHLLSLKEKSFSIEDVVEAVQSSRDYESALRYLSHECPICSEQVSFNKMVGMTHCGCTFCEDCFRTYFCSVIKEKSIIHVVCPVCSKPDLKQEGNTEEAMEYFNLLDIQIRHYLEEEVHALFQSKLRDRTLMKIPNFRWCAHCSFGVLHEAARLRMDCPSCGKSTCFHCKIPWEPQHEGLSCEKFKEWKENNNPEYQATKLDTYFTKFGIECPCCRFRYDLSKGGCLHFKCIQCHYEFCGGCKRPFKNGSACGFSLDCRMKGLHAHHSRNCFYHLRDWEIKRLQQLLDHKRIVYIPHTNKSRGYSSGKCSVVENKETVNGLTDEQCGQLALLEYGGFCEFHYKEYLVGLINAYSLDPAILYSKEEIFSELHRWKATISSGEEVYIESLRKKLINEIRLDHGETHWDIHHAGPLAYLNESYLTAGR
ncbi:uncharacterized protein SI:DKEY-181M9.8 isoform X2 [Latimeria chalumnae]|uniref:uncharacterized protein SI:DKEY-181M9.8 isoform X2 n=1 Tax=Latimeria chalumnae TaxID=7897 RepID=UPI00313D33BD